MLVPVTLLWYDTKSCHDTHGPPGLSVAGNLSPRLLQAVPSRHWLTSLKFSNLAFKVSSINAQQRGYKAYTHRWHFYKDHVPGLFVPGIDGPPLVSVRWYYLKETTPVL